MQTDGRAELVVISPQEAPADREAVDVGIETRRDFAAYRIGHVVEDDVAFERLGRIAAEAIEFAAQHDTVRHPPARRHRGQPLAVVEAKIALHIDDGAEVVVTDIGNLHA